MAKQLLKERFQQLAGIKPLYEQNEALKDIEDILLKAGLNFDDGLLGGVGSGGAGYYDHVNDNIYGFDQSGPWNEEEFSKFYDNFSKDDFAEFRFEKEVSQENEDGINYDMVAQMVRPGLYAVGNDGYAQIHDNGDIQIFSIPSLYPEGGKGEILPAFKMDSSGNAVPQFSKDEMRTKLKDEKYYII